VLLNTSLNKRGMPIVETPLDAISLLLETALDAMIIEDFRVVKKQQPPLATQTADLGALFRKVCELATADKERPQSLGVLKIVVTGTEQAWTLDFSGSPKIASNAAPPDHTIVLTLDAVREVLRDPGTLRPLFENGQVQVPGLGLSASQPEVLLALWEKMNYLVSLMRSH
jgi:hypothetical protein